ncbi:MAG: DUF4091 domain-containing protein, partial [Siphonobacter aquaeclarae]|nr:DUF4091 domain-containing protein [Siphonobacter aquaeclarae]
MKAVFSTFVFLFFWKTLSVFGQAPLSEYYKKQWSSLAPGTRVSFGNANVHDPIDRVPTTSMSDIWRISAWRGETVHTKVLIWSTDSLPDIRCKVSNLISLSGKRIEKAEIQARFLRYVKTDGYFGNGCNPRKNSQLDSSLVADLIDTVSFVSVAPRTVQPIWLSIHVPENTSAGRYQGYVTVYTSKPYRLRVDLQVLPHALPSLATQSFRLDLWQYPVSIARVHNVTLWSDDHFSFMRPYYELLAAAGQRTITTTIVEGGNQNKEVSPAMIRTVRRSDGSWSYDYSLFDRYVSFVMECGIKEYIHCFTLVPWSGDLGFFDEAKGRDSVFHTTAQSEEFRNYWRPFLQDFAKHLKAKNWFNRTRLAMDERKVPDMLAAIELARQTDPDWQIALAGSYHPELIEMVQDYSIYRSSVFSDKDLDFRRKNGYTSTFYTSCEGEHPNMFTFSPPAESVWIGWLAAAKGMDGYLRWAYNLWPKYPEMDSRGPFPAGDMFLVYPGPKSSVRFEKLKEGIQDFGKIKILLQNSKRGRQHANVPKLIQFLKSMENEWLDTHPADEILQQAKKLLN